MEATTAVLEGHSRGDAAAPVAGGAGRLRPLHRRPYGVPGLCPSRRPAPARRGSDRAPGRPLAFPVPAARIGSSPGPRRGSLSNSDTRANRVTFGRAPNLNHIWQRFLLTSSLLIGLAIGVAATVFGYSNLTSVDVHWSVFHINGAPLWTVTVVPLALALIAGTVYHWMDGLHHFTEHMRHRRRVHELEAEVASLRSHLDQLLEMPDHSTSKLPDRIATTAFPAAGNGTTEISGAEVSSTEADDVPAVSTKKARS